LSTNGALAFRTGRSGIPGNPWAACGEVCNFGVARLEKVFEEIDESPRGKTCDAIIGIIEEGQEVMKEFRGTPALDGGLLAAAQAVEHYEIARYGP
jgi:ferritin-like metal-binding protein YciE